MTDQNRDIFKAIVSQLYSCETEMIICEEIEKCEQLIREKKFERIFRTFHTLCVRSSCLILCNLFDDTSEKHTLANFKELIGRIGGFNFINYEDVDACLARMHIISKTKNRKNAQSFKNFIKKRLYEEVSRIKKRDDVGIVLDMRNKGLAHGEYIGESLPDFDNGTLRVMLNFAHDLANFLNEVFEELHIEDCQSYRKDAERHRAAICRLLEQIGIQCFWPSELRDQAIQSVFEKD